MKVTINIVFSVLLIFLFILFSGCSKKAQQESMTISQLDIDLLIQHKKKIDLITKKYDSILTKTQMKKRPEVIEKGKAEINSYLKSKDLNPILFMRKSKKIIKGYIAFYNTSDDAVKKRKKLLEDQNLTKKELETNIEAFKKEKERLFFEMTTDLSDYEIELIKNNLHKISTVIKL